MKNSAISREKFEEVVERIRSAFGGDERYRLCLTLDVDDLTPSYIPFRFSDDLVVLCYRRILLVSYTCHEFMTSQNLYDDYLDYLNCYLENPIIYDFDCKEDFYE